jgi:hypothetical protein
MKTVPAIVCSIALAIASAGATQVPVAVTGFNQDMVVDAGTPLNPVSIQSAVSAAMDTGTTKLGNSWYEVGANSSAPVTGLPMNTTFVSSADPATSFSLQSAADNNAVLLDSDHTNGNFLLTTPGLFSSLSLLGASANGPTVVALTLQFTDSSTLSLGNIVVPDWFNSAPIAYNANGRIDLGTATFADVSAGNPRLYQLDVSLSGVALNEQISGVLFTDMNAGSARAAIFGLSGTVVSVPETATTMLLITGFATLTVLRRFCLPVRRGSGSA